MPFSNELIQKVWEKGIPVENYNPEKFRIDSAGAWIVRDQYGQETDYGWTIDHIFPECKGGSNDLLNLRPMQWENNNSKSDDFPDYKAVITRSDNKNIRSEQNLTVNEGIQKQLNLLFGIKVK